MNIRNFLAAAALVVVSGAAVAGRASPPIVTKAPVFLGGFQTSGVATMPADAADAAKDKDKQGEEKK